MDPFGPSTAEENLEHVGLRLLFDLVNDTPCRISNVCQTPCNLTGLHSRIRPVRSS